MHKRSIAIREVELYKLGDAARMRGEALLEKLTLDNPWKHIGVMLIVSPMAQPRPRFRVIRQGAFHRVHAYDPPESDSWKEEFGIKVGALLPEGFPKKGTVEIRAKVFKKIPKSYSSGLRWLCEAGEVRPEKKPDADNYVKAIKDALTGWVWEDDSQAVLVECEKFYSAVPRVEFVVRYRDRPLDRIAKKKRERESDGNG